MSATKTTSLTLLFIVATSTWLLPLSLGWSRRYGQVSAFTNPAAATKIQKTGVQEFGSCLAKSKSKELYCMGGGDILEGLKRFLVGDSGEDSSIQYEKIESISPQINQRNNLDNAEKESDDDDDDELPAGTTLLLSIPAKQLKPGGLRLFLMFYLLGMQNTPHPNAWKANQPVQSDYVLEMYFGDATGMIQIELLDRNRKNHNKSDQTRYDPNSSDTYEVRVLRCGSLPSTAYLMQESVIVDGILDELQQCAFDESIEPHDRLLIPEPATAIEEARQALAFG